MEQIYKILLANNITPNELFLMWMIKNGKPLTKMNTHLEVRNLQNNELLQPDSVVLTEKANFILSEVEQMVKKTVTKIPEQMSSDDIDARIKTYLSIWPQRVLPSGKPARVSAKVIKDSFKWFFTNYDYSWQVILAATQMYIDKQENDNYRACRTSQYFIVKTTPEKIKESVLADYCELVLAGGDEDLPYFREKVV